MKIPARRAEYSLTENVASPFQTEPRQNSTGVYTLSTISPGPYILSLSKTGFVVFKARNVEAPINSTVRVDAKLTLQGQSPETITVSAITVALQTDRADVRGLVLSGDLQQLPQPTRTPCGDSTPVGCLKLQVCRRLEIETDKLTYSAEEQRATRIPSDLHAQVYELRRMYRL